MDQTALIVHHYLLYLILPLWILAGVADYAMHRASHIASTSGTKESFLHLLMLAEVGIPLLLGLFFEINALIMLIMLTGLILHQITGWLDVHLAYHSPRKVTPLEQHVHSFLEILPIMAFSFVIILHWPEFLALLELAGAKPDFSFTYKASYWSTSYIIILLTAVFFLLIVPFAEEFFRCLWKTGKKEMAGEYPPPSLHIKP